jgi:hypothetical protein
MWFYVQRILIPYQEADAALHGRPRGNLSDLYPRWLGTQELLLHHRNPYSPEVTREIQVGYYGRALDADRAEDPKDQQGFAYPVYVAFFLAPTIFFSFAIVKSLFGWFLAVLTCATVFLWLRVLQWKPPTVILVILLVLTLGCFPTAQGIKLQQLTLVVCALIAGSAVLIACDYLVLAGILLASATVKPQVVVLLIPWILLWAGCEWRNRKRFFVGFSVTTLLLLGGGELISPGWIGQFRSALTAYRQYTGGGGSVLETLISPLAGKLLGACLVLGLVVVCWKSRHALATSSQFSCTMALVLAVTVTVIPMTAPYNQLLLLPAIYLLVRDYLFIKKNILLMTLFSVCALLIFWPWLAAAGLSLASCFVPAAAVQKAWALPLYTSLAIPPAVVVLLTPNVLALLRRSSDNQISPNLA